MANQQFQPQKFFKFFSFGFYHVFKGISWNCCKIILNGQTEILQWTKMHLIEIPKSVRTFQAFHFKNLRNSKKFTEKIQNKNYPKKSLSNLQTENTVNTLEKLKTAKIAFCLYFSWFFKIFLWFWTDFKFLRYFRVYCLIWWIFWARFSGWFGMLFASKLNLRSINAN